MAKFFHGNDLRFIKTIAEEVVDSIVEQWITLFKVSVGETKTNLYGESLGRIYHAPANLMCIVDREPQTINYEGFGADKNQAVEFRFMRNRLRTLNLPVIRTVNNVEVPADAIQTTQHGYPEIGDVISFDNTFFEIDHIRETQLVGGSPLMFDSGSNESLDTRMTLIATGIMVKRSQVQIEERSN